MSRPSFNVLTEPWIPAITRDGPSTELGIIDCLTQAHELREIRDPSPIIEFGVYRLLVAFVLDMFLYANRMIEDIDDLRVLLNEGAFDHNMIDAYIKSCGDVFDLFDDARPFLQTRIPQGKDKSLAGMYPAIPSGTNVMHWHHKHEDDVRLAPKEAARLLTTISPFMTSGGAGLSPSINGAPPIYALPVHENLFGTLIINLPIRRQDSGNGSVAWRSTREPGVERSEATTTEAMTWRPRRVQLNPDIAQEQSINVRKMKFEKGDSTRLDWIDASLGYCYTKDGFNPIRMRDGRPLWRDAGPLCLLNDVQHGSREDKVSFCRPDIVRQAFELSDLARSLSIQFYGMRSDMKMKIFEWTKTILVIPSKLGRDTRLGTLVHSEMAISERISNILRKSVVHLYPREGEGNKSALGRIVERCQRSYWLRLEVHFRPMLMRFSELDENSIDDIELIMSAVRPWREVIKTVALEEFETVAKDMDSDSNALERQVHARLRLKSNLRKVLS